MIDNKILRNNKDLIRKNLEKRKLNFDLDYFFNLYDKLRANQQITQELSSKRNKLSKEIGILKAQGKEAASLIEEVSKTKNLEDTLISTTKGFEAEFEALALQLPNILSDEVPFGEDESDNVEIRRVGIPRKFDFEPKDHGILGEEIGMIDFKKAASISGSRFVILKSDISKLERALINFMLDHNSERGYEEHSVPHLVNAEALVNTGQLPKFSEDLFSTTDHRWLIPTTEVPLTNLVQKELLARETLPLRFTGFSMCFRSEAGSAGKDTKGMLRQHQFAKVELVSITEPQRSFHELEYMLETSESILKELELPYRVVLLCSGDVGFSAAKTYDIEVWLPSQNSYREISSCSNCTDFQARRMLAKISDNKDFVHTLNGSALAVGRTLIAIIENYQQEDGSIVIPKVLVPYMKNQCIIKAG